MVIIKNDGRGNCLFVKLLENYCKFGMCILRKSVYKVIECIYYIDKY